MKARGLILAAPASGSGKTLVTAGLLRHLRRRGLRVAAAKAGPDFIDPTFHAAASGGACVNLDPWAMRPHTLAARVAALEAAAEIVLCEGVMGLFDGTGADGEAGSTAELAQRTGWPVVLVVDARGQGASVAALLRGFACHRPETAARRRYLQPGRERTASRAARRRGSPAPARPRHARSTSRRPGAGPAVAPSRPGSGRRNRRGRGGDRPCRGANRPVVRYRPAAAAGAPVAARRG